MLRSRSPTREMNPSAGARELIRVGCGDCLGGLLCGAQRSDGGFLPDGVVAPGLNATACSNLVAEAGANLRELMERMGHTGRRAALMHLHSTPGRQAALADAIAEWTINDLRPK
jgi:hypothetical protein